MVPVPSVPALFSPVCPRIIHRKGLAIMSSVERSTVTAWGGVGIAFGLFCLWFLFSWTELIHHAEAVIRSMLPVWFVVVNLALMPCLVALSAGASLIPLPLRLALGAMMFCSAVIFEVSFRRFPVVSGAVLAILLLEVYWIIPRWNASRR